MQYRHLALSVIQLDVAEFHWVLMEADGPPGQRAICYRPVDSSAKRSAGHAEALIAGAVALRRMQGRSPFGPPLLGVGSSAISPNASADV
jgi:hypothetical protein